MPTSRLGGHLVSGHVDGIGEVKEQIVQRPRHRVLDQGPGELSRYIAEKGSIAVDGISLTVNAVQGDLFRLTIVPHTPRRPPSPAGNLATGSTSRIRRPLFERLMTGKARRAVPLP
jgi:riboflavin synthase